MSKLASFPWSKGIKSRRAAADVIKIIIFLSLTISFSIGMTNIMRNEANEHLGIENVEIYTSGCFWNNQEDYWDIAIKMKNRGASDVTFSGVYINGFEVDDYNKTDPVDGEAIIDMYESQTLRSGEIKIFHLYIDGPGGKRGWQKISSGTSMSITVHSVHGMDYPMLLTLV